MMIKLQASYSLLTCDASVDSASRTSITGLGLPRTASLDVHFPLHTVFQNIHMLVSWSFLGFEKKINQPKHYSLGLLLMLRAGTVI